MIPKPLDRIDRPDLERLLTEQVHEGRTLDYKRDIHLSTDEHRRELARDVSSFANAAGGDLIFGVEEAKDENGKNLGYPEKVVGVECPNFDDTKQRIESIIRENIDPRIHGFAIRKLDGFERGSVILLRIPRSWNAPHMVSYKSQTHFYSRNSFGKHPLDVREIRAAFLEGTERATRVRRFRDERLGRIIAGETPVPLAGNDGAILVMHVVPVTVGQDAELDLVSLSKNPASMPPPRPGTGWNSRFNLDGFVTFSGPNEGPQRAYLQAFRNGAFEGVVTLPYGQTKPPTLNAIGAEKAVVDVGGSCISLIRGSGIDAPVVIAVGVIGAKGAQINRTEWVDPDEGPEPIDRDPLVLPDALVEEARPDLRAVLRPMFDALWQSSGWERSFGYDADGRWRQDLHR